MSSAGGGGNIKVIGRIRPLSNNELTAGESEVLQVVDTCTLNVYTPNGFNNCKTFQLDGILDQHASQLDMFQNIEALLTSALDGFNCTIFTCTIIYHFLIYPFFCMYDSSYVQMGRQGQARPSRCWGMTCGPWQGHTGKTTSQSTWHKMRSGLD